MTPEQAATFAMNIIKEVKTAMILGGFGEPQDVLYACNTIYNKLGGKLPMDMIIEAFSMA